MTAHTNFNNYRKNIALVRPKLLNDVRRRQYIPRHKKMRLAMEGIVEVDRRDVETFDFKLQIENCGVKAP